MKLIISLTVILGMVAGLPQPNISPRIINGITAQPHSIPYQAFLISDTNMGIQWCSGTLISNNWVLTAGYCINEASFIEVKLGVNNRSENEDTQLVLNASSYIIHPEFDYWNRTNDIALVELPYPVETNEYIQIAPLLSRSNANDDYEGQTGTYSGWGLPAYFNYESTQLLTVVNATLISYEECANSYENLLPNTLCTSSEGGVVSWCRGDQGGPLVVDGVQVGIISYGDPWCLWDGGEWPSIFTKIGSFVEWIEENSDYVFRE